MAAKLKVTLLRSLIGRPQPQRRVVAGLGLTRINSTKVLVDTEAVRGMIRKVQHLVSVEVAPGG